MTFAKATLPVATVPTSIAAGAMALAPFSVHLAEVSAPPPLIPPTFLRSHCILRGTKPPRQRSPRHPPRCSASNGEEITRSQLLWRAVKLPIYSVALVPLTVSSLFKLLLFNFRSSLTQFCFSSSSSYNLVFEIY